MYVETNGHQFMYIIFFYDCVAELFVEKWRNFPVTCIQFSSSSSCTVLTTVTVLCWSDALIYRAPILPKGIFASPFLMDSEHKECSRGIIPNFWPVLYLVDTWCIRSELSPRFWGGLVRIFVSSLSKYGIAPLKQTLCSEYTRNSLAKRPLGRICAQCLYPSNEHRTVVVAAKVVQEPNAENWMHVTWKSRNFSTNSLATQCHVNKLISVRFDIHELFQKKK